MTTAVVMVILLGPFFLMWFITDILPASKNYLIQRKINKLEKDVKVWKEETAYYAPNQQTIDALEAEIFGGFGEVSKLPGYKWKINPNYSDTYSDNVIMLYLVNPHNISISGRKISKTTAGNYHKNLKEPVHHRTAEELDEVIQYVMKEEIAKEVKRLNNIKAVDDIVSKYNGKAVME